MKSYVRGVLERTIERILERMAYATKREQALVLELAQTEDRVAAVRITAEERLALLEAATALADERVALLAASAALADERLALLTAAATRAESVERQLGLERREHDLAAKHAVRLELRVQALKRRRERLQAQLCKLQDQLARADTSGSIRELQREKAQLQQRLTDLETYFTLRIEPPNAATNLAEVKQGSANPR